MLGELARLTSAGNTGGRNRTPIVTAYREDALRCAQALASAGAEPVRLRELRAATGVADAAGILQRNVYGWFARLGHGSYALSAAGHQALGQFAETVAALAAPAAEQVSP